MLVWQHVRLRDRVRTVVRSHGGHRTLSRHVVPAGPVNLKLLDLGRAPYVLYGVKYIDLVSLEVAQARQSQILAPRPFFSKWLASIIWI